MAAMVGRGRGRRRRGRLIIPPIPPHKPEPTTRIAVIFDTSGSIDENMLDFFARHLADIINMVKPKTVWVMDCDVVVHHVYRYDWPEVNILARGRPTVTGRGATAFTPPFRVMIERGIKPDYIIYMTDLQPTAENPWPELPGLFAQTGADELIWLVPEWCKPRADTPSVGIVIWAAPIVWPLE